MEKYKYEVSFKDLSDQKEIKFNSTNHDDVFNIISRFRDLDINVSSDDKIAFIVGLKLFIETILKNKNEKPFNELFPMLKDMMKVVKSSFKE
ncbi:DUF3861 family protein [Campylobacter corcagiensis]|uniref:DUF3861 family protein n=1 Tax=Campylobacter corcagiensis TaxID=1448857 RepID=A0A7M1LJI6_9BACT|nr:DUF3861 family protein [Campylobacter corcagiensis]QKF65346.1 DUF3861 domain-containing protein [Campylobacter corcagiensis]QOQ88074.1 DUF3861 family protein [Campylobacter corcagiensis]